MITLEQEKQLILFDGVCNFCNSSVVYIIKRDKHNTFLFAPLQSDIGQKVIETHNIDTTKIDSILLYIPEEGVFVHSTAALKIASKLKFPVNLLSIFFIIPKFIRNAVYKYIAKNRYKWFGKKESCMIPTPEIKEKFIE